MNHNLTPVDILKLLIRAGLRRQLPDVVAGIIGVHDEKLAEQIGEDNIEQAVKEVYDELV